MLSSPDSLIVDIQDLHLHYETSTGIVPVLCGINLQIKPQTTTVIMGPSGSGKTSLLMAMAGLEKPQKGLLKIGQQNILQFDEASCDIFRRDQIGIVFQSFHLIPTMSVLENVYFPLLFSTKNKTKEDKNIKSLTKHARDILQTVGIPDRYDLFPGEFSGGEQQRIAIARALVKKPTLFLADEPTGNLDQHTGDAILDTLLTTTMDSESSLVIITHDPNIAKRADSVFLLKDGQLVQQQ